MRMTYCIGVGKNRQCECIIDGITIDGHVDNASDYPVIKVFVSLYYDRPIFYPMKNISRTS